MKALIVFSSVVLALLLCEAYFRFLHTQEYTSLNTRWTEPFVGFGDFRNRNAREAPELFGYEKKNSIYVYRPRKLVQSVADRGAFLFGERTKEAFPETATKGAKRIFLMGGSAALGDGAEPGALVFPALLQQKLRESCHSENIFVIPATVRAFNSTQERIALELYVLPLHPNAVVFLHGFNDANLLESMSRPGDPYNQGIEYARRESFAFQTAQWFSQFSDTVGTLVNLWATRGVYDEIELLRQNSEKFEVFQESAAAVFLNNRAQMAKRCAQEKVPCYFYLQPAADPQVDPSVKHVWDAYERILKAPPVANSFNLSSLFRGRHDFFVDTVHVHGAAQALEAAEVVRKMKDVCP